MGLDVSVDTLPLAGRDQGWGVFGPTIAALAPHPTLPHQGGGAVRRAPDAISPSPCQGEARWGLPQSDPEYPAELNASLHLQRIRKD
jgi:hypothetical protein